jgi:hypothetical protein
MYILTFKSFKVKLTHFSLQCIILFQPNIFFKTYFKLEDISPNLITLHNTEMVKKYCYNHCKETTEKMVNIITSEYEKRIDLNFNSFL